MQVAFLMQDEDKMICTTGEASDSYLAQALASDG